MVLVTSVHNGHVHTVSSQSISLKYTDVRLVTSSSAVLPGPPGHSSSTPQEHSESRAAAGRTAGGVAVVTWMSRAVTADPNRCGFQHPSSDGRSGRIHGKMCCDNVYSLLVRKFRPR